MLQPLTSSVSSAPTEAMRFWALSEIPVKCVSHLLHPQFSNSETRKRICFSLIPIPFQQGGIPQFYAVETTAVEGITLLAASPVRLIFTPCGDQEASS